MKHLKKLFTLLLVFAITIAPLSSSYETYHSENEVSYDEEIHLFGSSPFDDREIK